MEGSCYHKRHKCVLTAPIPRCSVAPYFVITSEGKDALPDTFLYAARARIIVSEYR